MTGKQKRYLRSLAHSLKPVVQVGKQGLSPETFMQIEQQLEDHELIKVRVLDASPKDHRVCASELQNHESFGVVQLIGKTLVLYRPRSENPTIQIPE